MTADEMEQWFAERFAADDAWEYAKAEIGAAKGKRARLAAATRVCQMMGWLPDADEHKDQPLFPVKKSVTTSVKNKGKNSRQQAWQVKRAADGRCTVCGDPLDPASKWYCPRHLVERRTANRERYHATGKTRKAVNATPKKVPVDTLRADTLSALSHLGFRGQDAVAQLETHVGLAIRKALQEDREKKEKKATLNT